jgi:hypothetical protein
MHQRLAAILGAVATIGLFALTYAKRLADAISIIHLPHDAGEFLTAMSGTPLLVSYGALAIGIACLVFLAWSSWKPKNPKVVIDKSPHPVESVKKITPVATPEQHTETPPPSPLPSKATEPTAKQQLVAPESAKPPSKPYYTRAEIDGMITLLVELQRFFKSKPATNEAVQKMTEGSVVEFLRAPDLLEYPQIADGLEQYAEQLKNDNAEVERLTKDTDEFVWKAVPIKYPPRLGPDPFYQFHKIVAEAAEELRRTMGRTTDKGLAALAIRAKQQEFFMRYEKYTASIHEAQKKISEKIADLRSR